jgi:DNA polymerase II small subunit/DNA polymerase delta subunit B
VIKKLELVGTVIVLLKPVAFLSGILPPLPVPVKVRVAALAGRVASTAIAPTVPAKTTPDRDLRIVVVFIDNFG